MGSADLMPRTLDHWVETLFPIEDDAIRNHIVTDILEGYLRDTARARVLQPDGTYTERGAPILSEAKDHPAYDVQGALLERVISEPEVVFPLSALPKRYRKYLS